MSELGHGKLIESSRLQPFMRFDGEKWPKRLRIRLNGLLFEGKPSVKRRFRRSQASQVHSRSRGPAWDQLKLLACACLGKKSVVFLRFRMVLEAFREVFEVFWAVQSGSRVPNPDPNGKSTRGVASLKAHT